MKYWSYPKFSEQNGGEDLRISEIEEVNELSNSQRYINQDIDRITFPDPKEYIIGFFVTT